MKMFCKFMESVSKSMWDFAYSMNKDTISDSSSVGRTHMIPEFKVVSLDNLEEPNLTLQFAII